MTADDFEPIPFDTLTDDDTPADLPWLWDGYLMPGDMALLTAPPKSGKTTLLTGLLRALGRGEAFLGRSVRPGRVWVVSEEPKRLWAERNRIHPVGPHARLLPRPFPDGPTPDRWSRLIDAALADRPDLCVVDTFAHFLPGSESDAGTVRDFLRLLRRFSSAGGCVLLLHHPRKREAERGRTARGSGALPGFVDVVMEIDRYSRLDSDVRRRRLFARSRRPDTPPRLDYEWDAASNEFRLVEDQPQRQFQENREAVLGVLREFGVPLTHAEILQRWPEELERPGRVTLFRWLNKAHEQKLVRRSGRGRANDPWRYWLETDADRERDRLNELFTLPPLPELRGWND